MILNTSLTLKGIGNYKLSSPVSGQILVEDLATLTTRTFTSAAWGSFSRVLLCSGGGSYWADAWSKEGGSILRRAIEIKDLATAPAVGLELQTPNAWPSRGFDGQGALEPGQLPPAVNKRNTTILAEEGIATPGIIVIDNVDYENLFNELGRTKPEPELSIADYCNECWNCLGFALIPISGPDRLPTPLDPIAGNWSTAAGGISTTTLDELATIAFIPRIIIDEGHRIDVTISKHPDDELIYRCYISMHVDGSFALFGEYEEGIGVDDDYFIRIVREGDLVREINLGSRNDDLFDPTPPSGPSSGCYGKGRFSYMGFVTQVPPPTISGHGGIGTGNRAPNDLIGGHFTYSYNQSQIDWGRNSTNNIDCLPCSYYGSSLWHPENMEFMEEVAVTIQAGSWAVNNCPIGSCTLSEGEYIAPIRVRPSATNIVYYRFRNLLATQCGELGEVEVIVDWAIPEQDLRVHIQIQVSGDPIGDRTIVEFQRVFAGVGRVNPCDFFSVDTTIPWSQDIAITSCTWNQAIPILFRCETGLT